MADIIQVRRDTAANWTSVNPTLAQGEQGYETDTGLLKFGDGVTAWNSLSYFPTVATDALLTAIAALVTSADKGMYFTGIDAVAMYDLTAYGRSLAGVADEAAFKSLVNLEAGIDYQAYDATLAAFAAYNTNGILTQTGADTFTGRTITGTADKIDVTNGDGVSGNPTLTISATYAGQATIATVGTITAGTWQGTAISDTYISSAATWNSKAASGANTDITSVLLSQTGLVVKGATANALTIKPNETLSAGRTLNVITGDATRSLTFTADATIGGTHSGTSSGTNTGDQTITLTGDVTGSGTGSFAATLATVNSNVGSFTNANITVNAKGLITAASSGTSGSGASFSLVTQSTAITLDSATHNGKTVELTGSTNRTWAFTAAATLTSSWAAILVNSSTAELTLDPNGSETIDGLTTFKMYPGEKRLVVCDGSNFFSYVLHPFYLTVVQASSPFTFTKPPGYKAFGLRIGAGGGSGGGGTSTSQRGGGGGGGATREKTLIASTVGTTETITIGAGGAAVTSGNGNAGNNSSFGSLLTVYAGGAGGGNVASGAGGGGGGHDSAGANAAGATGANGGNPYPGDGTSGVPGRVNWDARTAILNASGASYNGGGGGQDTAGSTGGDSYNGGGGGGIGGATASTAGGRSVTGGGGGGGCDTTNAGAAGGASEFGSAGGQGGNSSGVGTAGTTGTNGYAGGGGGGSNNNQSSGKGGDGSCAVWGIA